MTIQIHENVSLKPYHTFHVDIIARRFCKIESLDDLLELIQTKELQKHNYMFLGEGSDVLFTKDYDGLIVKDECKGIDLAYENDDFVWLKVNSGENWHSFVEHCVDNGWGGVENLALIPGTVGAAPIQNIGAYGVELKDSLHSIEVIDLETGEEQILMNDELNFGYRWSIFKEEEVKGKYFISTVTFQLLKNPECNITYKDVAEEIADKEINVKSVFDAVVAIRTRKLPDPDEIGNAGSFFKNPIISRANYEALLVHYHMLKSYPAGENVKLPAAQLIDLCNWKQVRKGDVGVYKTQALVICNYGNATGQEIYQFALDIQQSVKEKFGVDIHPEVNII